MSCFAAVSAICARPIPKEECYSLLHTRPPEGSYMKLPYAADIANVMRASRITRLLQLSTNQHVRSYSSQSLLECVSKQGYDLSLASCNSITPEGQRIHLLLRTGREYVETRASCGEDIEMLYRKGVHTLIINAPSRDMIILPAPSAARVSGVSMLKQRISELIAILNLESEAVLFTLFGPETLARVCSREGCLRLSLPYHPCYVTTWGQIRESCRIREDLDDEELLLTSIVTEACVEPFGSAVLEVEGGGPPQKQTSVRYCTEEDDDSVRSTADEVAEEIELVREMRAGKMTVQISRNVTCLSLPVYTANVRPPCLHKVPKIPLWEFDDLRRIVEKGFKKAGRRHCNSVIAPQKEGATTCTAVRFLKPRTRNAERRTSKDLAIYS